MARPVKLAAALVATILVLGMVLGVGQAAAASLPGEFLYGAKLGAERVRLELTTRPESRAALALDLAEERLDEITAMVELGQAVDDATVARAQRQLVQAIHRAVEAGDKAPSWSHQRLMAAIQRHRRDVESAISLLSQVDQTPVRQLFRDMARARRELQTGQGTPPVEGMRARKGTPPDAADLPDPSDEQPGPGPGSEAPQGTGGPNPVAQPGPGPAAGEAPDEPAPIERPSWAPGPQNVDAPAGSEPAGEPGAGLGPQPANRSGDPETQPSQEPGDAEPQPTPMPTPTPVGPGPIGAQEPDEGSPGREQPPGSDNDNGRNGRP
jgi:hypothetical protein